MSESLNREIWASVALHLCIVMMITLKAVLVPDQPIEIRRAIRVEVVGLPDKIVEPPSKPIAESKAAPPTTTKPTPSKPEVQKPKMTNPTKPAKHKTKEDAKTLRRSQEKALSQIEAMRALERVKSDVQEQTRKPIAGNQLADGDSLTGLDRIEYDRYFGQIENAVKTNWRVPQWLADANLSAQILVRIDERGYVIDKRILRSSGNETFDNQMVAAVEESSPLPAPPGRLVGLLATSGIVFRFPE